MVSPEWLINQPPPKVTPPPRNMALLRVYKPLVSLNKALLSQTLISAEGPCMGMQIL